MSCKVCNDSKKSKYKCPRCLIPYCSLECWKSHNEINCNKNDKVIDTCLLEQKPSNYNHTTESTIPNEKLKLLETSENVRIALQNPHVRDMLKLIDCSENPAAAMQDAMLEPIFQEFADACLDVVDKNSGQEIT